MNAIVITYHKSFPSGAWDLSTVLRGVRISRRYIGYTKREATRMFRAEVRAM